MTVSETNRAVVSPLVRRVAAVGVLASVLGRAVAPALRGATEGIDGLITYANLLGGFATYLFAFGGLIALVLEMRITSRDKGFGVAYRTAAAVASVCTLALVLFAFRAPLPERASVLAALVSSTLALFASREALAVPRTRALGVTLAAAAIAALLHLSGGLLAWYAGESALYRLALVARGLAAGSVFFDAVALLTGFAWLTTRREAATVWIARAALFVGCVIAWGALRGAREGAPLWELVASRALDRLAPDPPPALVWPSLLLEACAPFLGAAALVARRQMPAIAASLALTLIARPGTDVPLSALALVLASLSAPLAARDDRGMWAVLMAPASVGAPRKNTP